MTVMTTKSVSDYFSFSATYPVAIFRLENSQYPLSFTRMI